VQPRPVRQHGVDERAAQVDPAARGLEHPLDQVANLTPVSIVVVSSAMPPLATNTRLGSAIQISWFAVATWRLSTDAA